MYEHLKMLRLPADRYGALVIRILMINLMWKITLMRKKDKKKLNKKGDTLKLQKENAKLRVPKRTLIVKYNQKVLESLICQVLEKWVEASN